MTTINVPLTQGYICIIDDADADLVLPFKWQASVYRTKNQTIIYASRSSSRLERPRMQILMHRMILRASKGVLVDHIDHNGLNNQRKNLRLASDTQNRANSRIKRPESGFVGVRKWRHTFSARIDVNYTPIIMGGFATAEEAARARDHLAIQHFGKFANLNFPGEALQRSPWIDQQIPDNNSTSDVSNVSVNEAN